MSESEPLHSALAANTLLFVRMLRAIDIPVGMDRTAEFLTALSLVDIRSRRDVYFSARALLLSDPGKLAAFNQAFDHFWRIHGSGGQMSIRTASSRSSSEGRGEDGTAARVTMLGPGSGAGDNQPQDNGARAITGRYSAAERLRQVDLADLNTYERKEVDRAILRMPIAAGRKTSRRYRRGAGRRLDLENILRAGARHHGEWFALSYLRRRERARNLLVFMDISGSMASYGERYLHLCYALCRRWPARVEVFALATRLTHLSQALRGPTVSEALGAVSRRIEDWGGGTRLGETLRAFNLEWASRTTAGGPVTVLASDGWDRGDIDLLEQEMDRLSRTSHRILWMNPLIDRPGYEPRTRALLAAERYVDAFLPSGTLTSLEQAVRIIMQAAGERTSVSPPDPAYLYGANRS